MLPFDPARHHKPQQQPANTTSPHAGARSLPRKRRDVKCLACTPLASPLCNSVQHAACAQNASLARLETGPSLPSREGAQKFPPPPLPCPWRTALRRTYKRRPSPCYLSTPVPPPPPTNRPELIPPSQFTSP